VNEFRALALTASVDNKAAADFLCSLVDALHLWDDLIDKDKPVEDERVHKVFTNMLVELPRNPFYLAHSANLAPVLVCAIQNWHLANRIERGEADELPVEAAFVLRSSYVDLVTVVATICGGYPWGVEVARRVRALAHEEGFEGYKQNLEAERLARSAQAEE
jgi:hypothetical protein